MKPYHVSWEIELTATDPIEAAKEALDSIINGTAKIFVVTPTLGGAPVEIDLEEED